MQAEGGEHDARLRHIFVASRRRVKRIWSHLQNSKVPYIHVYMRRRLTQLTLPTVPSDADTIVRGSRSAKLNGDDFNCGFAGSLSAFEKWSGRVVPKSCRKGMGRWAMTLKGK